MKSVGSNLKDKHVNICTPICRITTAAGWYPCLWKGMTRTSVGWACLHHHPRTTSTLFIRTTVREDMSFIVILNVKLTFLHLIILRQSIIQMKITLRSSRGLVKRITLFSLSPITNEGEGGRVVGTQINKMTNSETNLNLLRPLLDLICYNNAAGEKIIQYSPLPSFQQHL